MNSTDISEAMVEVESKGFLDIELDPEMEERAQRAAEKLMRKFR